MSDRFSLTAVALGISTTLGAAFGAIGSALIGARARKPQGEGALVISATQLTDRLLRRNDELAHINRQARQALSKLISAVQIAQDTFEKWPDIGDGEKNREMMVILQLALDTANSVEL